MSEKIKGYIVSLFLLGIFFTIVSWMVIITGTYDLVTSTITEEETRTYSYVNILSLERKHETTMEASGGFFLGFSASSSTNITYYAYSKEERGYTINAFPLFKNMSLLSAYGSTRLYLVETNDETPKYKYGFDKCEIKTNFYSRFIDEDRYICETYRKLIVPIGTVQKEFRG